MVPVRCSEKRIADPRAASTRGTTRPGPVHRTPTGACCLRDGSCLVVTQAECEGLLGTYQGDNSTCADAGCPPLGACCIENNCFVLPQIDCEAQGGTFSGVGISCENIDCTPVPTVGSTWGQIKARYR